MENQLIQNFKALGLDEKESLVMTALINGGGKISLADLEKLTGLPQTTAYRILEDLVTKGLLNWQLGKQGKTVVLGNFENYINGLKQQHLEMATAVDSISKLLGNEQPKPISRPQIKYFEGVEGVRQLIWNTLSAKSEVLVYTNIMRQEVIGKKWMVDYCLEFVNKGLRDRVLCDEEYAKDSYQKFGGRTAYFAPVDDFAKNSQERVVKSPIMRLKGETYIYDNTFATYSLEGDLLVGCEIESRDISDTQRSIFEHLWAQTTEAESIEKYI